MKNPTNEFELISFEELKRRKVATFEFRSPSFGLHDIAVFWDGTNVYALENACPHLFGALSDGIVRSGEVSCPLHGAMFDLATGKCTDSYTIDTTSYGIEVREGLVWVFAPEESTA